MIKDQSYKAFGGNGARQWQISIPAFFLFLVSILIGVWLIQTQKREEHSASSLHRGWSLDLTDAEV